MPSMCPELGHKRNMDVFDSSFKIKFMSLASVCLASSRAGAALENAAWHSDVDGSVGGNVTTTAS